MGLQVDAMSEDYQLAQREREEGSIGIGAMIVFIALILVAAVASTIIITTAEELQ
ncbi:MAG: flagellin, partial [Euryarchaeota archaeon]|nr:flagellin [Euryarchaeota archaeon]